MDEIPLVDLGEMPLAPHVQVFLFKAPHGHLWHFHCPLFLQTPHLLEGAPQHPPTISQPFESFIFQVIPTSNLPQWRPVGIPATVGSITTSQARHTRHPSAAAVPDARVQSRDARSIGIDTTERATRFEATFA